MRATPLPEVEEGHPAKERIEGCSPKFATAYADMSDNCSEMSSTEDVDRQ